MLYTARSAEVHGVADLPLAQRGRFRKVCGMIQMRKLFLLNMATVRLMPSMAIRPLRTLPVTHHFRRRGDIKRQILSSAFPTNNFSNAINVTGNEVAAQFSINGVDAQD